MATPDHAVQPAQPGAEHDPLPAQQHHPAQSPALAMVQQVRAQGWDAIDQIAAVAKQHLGEWPAIAHWLHQNRGNDFVSHVSAKLEAPAAGPDGKEPKATKFPIVLMHGLGAGPSSFDDAIPAAMRADGDAVFEVTAPPYESPEERAKAIAPQLEEILKKTGAAKLNLVAWSLGGLDARYLISSMGWANRIASLSTVGTPHRGAATADKVMSALPEAEAALSALHGLLTKVASIADHTPKTVDPTITAIDGALLKALNLARTLHLAPHATPDTKQVGGEAASPDVERANKLAAQISALARQYQSKLPDTVVTGLDVLARKMGGNVDNSMASEADVLAAIQSLTEAGAAKFNAANPDAKGVYYQSWAGVADNSGHLDDGDAKKLGKLADPHGDPHQVGNIGKQPTLQMATYLSRSKANGKLNDGVVPVESAEWGNYRGAVPADHNHLTRRGSEADQQRTGFDVVEFYKEMGEDLAKRGY